LWWRILDGTIFIPKKLVMNIRIPLNFTINDETKEFINTMISREENYIHIKNNAGADQETVKFPEFYRNTLNKNLFGDIEFKKIHQNFENLFNDDDEGELL